MQDIYKTYFTRNAVPEWRCPTCDVGTLALVGDDSLVSRDTMKTIKDRNDPEWEPDWDRMVFTCIFVCSNADCRESVCCSGSGHVSTFEYYDDDEGRDCRVEEEIYYPRYFNPPLFLMNIPEKCPHSVRQHLCESFSLFFADKGAALNCARAAVEELMTELGVKRFESIRSKRRRIMLHRRIELLQSKYDALKEILLAVKWLGNAGSHSGDPVGDEDVIAAYTLLEHVLSSLYDGKERELRDMARRINRRKGPVRNW